MPHLQSTSLIRGFADLKKAIDSKASNDDLTGMIHGTIMSNLQTAFNLQIVPEFSLPLLMIIPAIAGIIVATRFGHCEGTNSVKQAFILRAQFYNGMRRSRYLTCLVFVFFVLATIASSATIAYGHGLWADQSLPALIANRSVAVSASLRPDFIEATGQARLVVRTFDTNNNATIPGIDYRIAVQFRNETLLNQRFKSSDGIVVANLQPDKEISGWQILGKDSGSPNDQVQVAQSNPVAIKSRIFTDGGLYHIIATLE